MEQWYKEVGDLQAQAASIPQQGEVMEKVSEKQVGVETRIVRLIEPLKERRRILLASKEVHQVGRDLEDEIVSLTTSLQPLALILIFSICRATYRVCVCSQLWIQERLPMATSQEHGTSLQAVQQLMKKNQVIKQHQNLYLTENSLDDAGLGWSGAGLAG